MESYGFLLLLAITLTIAVATSGVIAYIFERPVAQIMGRLVADEIAYAWSRYLRFAIIVVGVTGGVRLWQMEQYIDEVALSTERWVLEIYRTVIGSMQSIAWMLLVFFVFALIAYVILRAFELRRASS